VLFPLIAALGNVPTAIIACAGIVLGVLVMARGRRGEAAAQVVDAPAAAAPPAMLPLLVPDERRPAPAVGHGPIRFITHPRPEPVSAEFEPAEQTAPAPEPAAESAPEPEPEQVPAPEPAPDPDPDPDPEPEAEAEADQTPEPEPEPEQPPVPPSPPRPPVPPTTFRQGTIRVGGLERGWKRGS
jgi:outer membrane biosynthesis protein TonB